MTMMNHRYANSGPILSPPDDGGGQAAYLRAAIAATNDLAYTPPVAPAAAGVISAVAGTSAVAGVIVPNAPLAVGQQFRVWSRLMLGYQFIRVGEGPAWNARIPIRLQWQRNAEGWNDMSIGANAELNGSTVINCGWDSATQVPPANPGMYLVGQGLLTAAAGDVIATRAVWQNNPIDAGNYLQISSSTESEGPNGGWFLETFVGLGPIVAP